jgi:heat shock protein HslJ/membrane-bound inhibitor of C-type lysozyme
MEKRLMATRATAECLLSSRGLPWITAAILTAATSACTQDPPGAVEDAASPQAAADALALDGTRWQVIAIDGEDVVTGSKATLVFDVDGKLAGNASCNQYFGNWSVSGSDLSLAPAGATMRACEEPLMSQERRFLEALPDTVRLEKTADGRVAFLDANGAVRVVVTPEAPVPQDLAGSESYNFMCADAGPAVFRFVGPDTISLAFAGQRYIMPSERSASGAKYVGDGAEFWNKGDEAMLTIGEQRYACQRVEN